MLGEAGQERGPCTLRAWLFFLPAFLSRSFPSSQLQTAFAFPNSHICAVGGAGLELCADILVPLQSSQAGVSVILGGETEIGISLSLNTQHIFSA